MPIDFKSRFEHGRLSIGKPEGWLGRNIGLSPLVQGLLAACQNVTGGARESRIPSRWEGRWRIPPYFRDAERAE